MKWINILLIGVLVSVFFSSSIDAQETSEELLVVEGAVVEDAKDLLELNSHEDTVVINNVLTISVSDHAEVSGQYEVNASGAIQYEFVGDVFVNGMKESEIEDLITKSLSKYFVRPQVKVELISGLDRTKVIYVLGHVKNPGKVYVKNDTITVRDALTQVGLPLVTADSSQARIVTSTAEEKKVDVKRLLSEGNLEYNLEMFPGDTLYIPEIKTDGIFRKVVQSKSVSLDNLQLD